MPGSADTPVSRRRTGRARRLSGIWALLAAGTLGAAAAETSAPAPSSPPAAPVSAETPAEPAAKVRDFEKDDPTRDAWRIEGADGPAPRIGIDAAHGESLSLPVAFPESTRVWRDAALVVSSLFGRKPALIMERIDYALHIPPDAFREPARIQCRLVLKDKDGLWFEALGRRRVAPGDGPESWAPAEALRPGWNEIRVDLSEGSLDPRPRGHGARWSRFRLAAVRSLGFAVQGDRPWTGAIALDDIATLPAGDRDFAGPFRLVDLEPAPPAAERWARTETVFRLNRPVLEPFRTREIRIDATFVGPGGTTLSVPAFYDQPFRREPAGDPLAGGGPERWIPEGPAHWKVRFTPPTPGRWTWRLRGTWKSPVSGREETAETPERTMEVADRPGRGYLRVSARDPRCFEFGNGEAFFPIGHSFRSPWDQRHIETVLRRDFVDLRPEDVADWGNLAADLGAEPPADGTPAAAVRSALGAEMRAAFSSWKKERTVPIADRPRALGLLNDRIRGDLLIEPSALGPWTGILEVRGFLEPDPKPSRAEQTHRLNRVLLEAALPQALRRTWTSDRGLGAYERLLPRLREAGINSFEVWMSSWWLADEWTGRWKGYGGLGRYNLENLCKLDRLVELAEAHGQYIHLTIDNHGKAAEMLAGQTGQCDHEWENSPYNRQNAVDGGFLARAADLFRDDRARELTRDRYRNLVARLGASTHVWAWELWSELDLIGHRFGRHRDIYASPEVRAWHEEMAGFLRGLDPGRRPIVTHYSGDWSMVDAELARKPFLDYVACDAYHNPNQRLLDMLRATESFALPMRKPFLITEFGGDWNASSLEGLEGDLLAGLWWGWMSRSAGTPLYWWFELLEQQDRYPLYRALARFTEGEDKRRGVAEPPLRTDWPTRFTGPDAGLLDALALGDGKVFWLWVHDREQIRLLPREAGARRRFDRTEFRFALGADRKDSPWTVEFWDAWTGERIDRRTVRSDAQGELALPLPAFTVHLAIKLRAGEAGP